jgi:hypothetical protein
MCEDFSLNFGDKRTDCCHNNAPSHTYFSTREFFYQTQNDCRPHPPYLSVHPVKMKMKGSNFDTTEANEVDSQAVLNSLREHGFQDAFQKWQ